MDVGDPSNFSRILDLYKHSYAEIRRHISGFTYTDDEIAETLRETYARTGYLLDPHGACGYRALVEGLQPTEMGVFLETAHPAKFYDTVKRIIESEVQIPERLQAFMKGTKQIVPMSTQFEDFKAYLMQR
jgi:threonine synthase